MSLYLEFRKWQDKLMELQQEGDELARRIEELEKQNQALQQRLVSNQPGDGFEALSALYDEGYHICPNSFAQRREEDCLFCLNFLHHKGRKDD